MNFIFYLFDICRYIYILHIYRFVNSSEMTTAKNPIHLRTKELWIFSHFLFVQEQLRQHFYGKYTAISAKYSFSGYSICRGKTHPRLLLFAFCMRSCFVLLLLETGIFVCVTGFNICIQYIYQRCQP